MMNLNYLGTGDASLGCNKNGTGIGSGGFVKYGTYKVGP